MMALTVPTPSSRMVTAATTIASDLRSRIEGSAGGAKGLNTSVAAVMPVTCSQQIASTTKAKTRGRTDNRSARGRKETAVAEKALRSTVDAAELRSSQSERKHIW